MSLATNRVAARTDNEVLRLDRVYPAGIGKTLRSCADFPCPRFPNVVVTVIQTSLYVGDFVQDDIPHFVYVVVGNQMAG